MIDFTNYPNFNKFKGINILSIDYGTKVTGLAQFTPSREPMPQPRGKIIFQSDEQLLQELEVFIEEDFIEVIVLGLPLYLDGNESEMTKTVLKFHKKLTNHFPDIEVYLQDETLSSTAAKERMLSSARYNFKVDLKKIDEVAATIILEDFITKTSS
ncbi:Holliday junction resolvase RuvX [Halobacteriovorax sp. HLS]|uniref:Holliday junction resolvase RuvX n=1 Tax=Halobacteriovorax sp. HLS TaxID=2234000 RepID=UPI000FDA6CCE|nr:Holliday junction resolvase RuvX [Halobacteriovorax sp. HLS]